MGGLVAKGAAAAGAAMTVMSGIIGKTGVDYNAMMEQSEVAWTTLLGTQKEAQDMLKDISDFTKATPFETEQVDMMAKYMHNAGLAGKELFDELLKVSDVSSAFAIPASEAKELTRQMSQVRQAGVAYTEDLNVLQDRGIPIYKAIADQVGINVAEVKKMASDGKLSSEIYLAAFDNIAKGVKGASEDQSKTFNGMISTMKDGLKILAGKLAEPMFDKLKNGMEKLLPLIDGFTELAKGNIGGFSEIVTKAFGQETGLKIMTFVFAVQDGMAKVKEYIEIGKDAIKGLFEAFKGNEGAAVSIMTRLGLDRDQIQMVMTIVEGIKSLCKNLIEFWTECFWCCEKCRFFIN